MPSSLAVDPEAPVLSEPVILGARLTEMRQRSGLRQAEVARRLGIDPSVPSLWEQGKRAVPPSRLQPLAEILGVSLDELVGVEPAPAATREQRSERPTRSMPLWSTVEGRLEAPLAARAPAPLLVGVVLDAERAEQPRYRTMLQGRLCERHRGELYPDAASSRTASARVIIERIAGHCAQAPDFLEQKHPLLERIFRVVLRRGGGPVPIDDLLQATRVPAPTLQRLSTTARAGYPLEWLVEQRGEQ